MSELFNQEVAVDVVLLLQLGGWATVLMCMEETRACGLRVHTYGPRILAIVTHERHYTLHCI